MTTATTVYDGLRAWAKGSYPLEAAVELLIRSFDGRFARSGNPWINTMISSTWLNAAAITDDEIAPLSGGERRLLRIARSLAGGEPVDLNEDIPGLSRNIVSLVLAAVAHASGSHEHAGEMLFVQDGRPRGFGAAPGSLYPWPDEA